MKTKLSTAERKEQFKLLLQATRERLGMSLDQFGDYMGVPPGTMQHWLSGFRKPSACAIRLLEVLNAVEALSPDTHATLIPGPQERKRRAAPRAPFDPAHANAGLPSWLGHG